MLLVTGGAGFIGSNFVLSTLAASGEPIVNLDKLGYAGNLENLASLEKDARHIFVKGDIADRELVRKLLARHKPRAIVHFAAESHVDRSIHGPGEFVQSNIVGTWALLEEAREYVKTAASESEGFRFLHVSTDEVFGSLGDHDPAFTEQSNYAPNSPYSASKAAADHLVRAYHHTYGLPTLVTNCSNNYGPYQLPEKLIPLLLHNALQEKPLPVYGDGKNVRDWLYVGDHCNAISTVLEKGTPGETYNIGGNAEKTNLEVVGALCGLLDELRPRRGGRYSELIKFVADRPGHDRRYAIDASKLARELGWRPTESFESGLRKTVQWYLAHQDWMAHATRGSYREWVEKNYAMR
jgi:dTDP-glucose 4,6-dehydratase